MSKMLFELKAPLAIAQARQDMGANNIWKDLRYYNMFVSRYGWKLKGERTRDLSHPIENRLFWSGKVALYKDSVYGCIVAEVVNEILNPNGELVRVDLVAENGWTKKNVVVGKDCVIIYSDETYVPPVLYVWAIANKIIEREDIVDSQDNMMRKPIMVTGEGEEFDNAVNKVMNVLSGVAWFNFNPKAKANNKMLLQDKPVEVLNMQAGNSYKALEIWESRKHYEELICDYLGYESVKNEKRERVNTLEVTHGNSICSAFYKSSTTLRKEAVEEAKKIGIDLEFIENIEQEKEVKDNGNQENNVDKVDSKE